MNICGNKKFILFILICLHCLVFANPPKLLVEIYTRDNPEQLLEQYHKNLSGEIPVHFLVLCNNDSILQLPNTTVLYPDCKSKVEAFNQGLMSYTDTFDLLLIIDDDYLPISGYDKIIAEAMVAHFPDYDGVLHFHSEPNPSINRTPVVGRKFYERLGNIFCSDYYDSYYDHELTYASRILGKEIMINEEIVRRISQEENLSPIDKAFSSIDKATFSKRRRDTFGLSEEVLKDLFPKDWSILICTLDEREKCFAYIYEKLSNQIKENDLEERIEILYFKDNRENSIGKKRNELMRKSHGMYVNFIDDDDDVHDDYIKMNYEKIMKHPDCVSLHGIITFDGVNPTSFIHSIQHHSFFEREGIYYRPPNHLNVIKRSIASQFLFPNISYGEDRNWAMQIDRTHLLKREEKLTTPYYFYKYVTNK